MITQKQEGYVRQFLNEKYFDAERIIAYLQQHDKVGDEIFEIAVKRDSEKNRIFVDNECGFQLIDVDTFVRRVPFYFFESNGRTRGYGNLNDYAVAWYFDHDKSDRACEKLYGILEKMYYDYKIDLADIFEYPSRITGSCRRIDVFLLWEEYLDRCFHLNNQNRCPENFLYEYNKARVQMGDEPIIFENGLVGFNEFFIRNGSELVIGGEFPCDNDGKPVLHWIGVWIENAKYVNATKCYTMTDGDSLERELHIGLAPTTKVYMKDIYNDNDQDDDVWYPVYFGSLVMEFKHGIIKYFRTRMGYTQQQVADAVGVQLRTYQTWESGQRIPDGYNLIRLINLLDIESVQDFVDNQPIYDNGLVKFRNRNKFF